ncbi:MAG: autotransporter domain-containing protein [Rhizobiales bacterium]|nr:autotransporter domain-containing protein [Hyphomicrobiales bacterium]
MLPRRLGAGHDQGGAPSRAGLRALALAGCSILALGLGSLDRAGAQSVSISGEVDPGAPTSPVWTVSGPLVFGNGSMTIAGGGRVFSDGSLLAYYDPGSTSAVTVTGAGSTWTDSNEIMVGIWGRASVTVSAGATVISDAASIGVYGGSVGAVTVTGPGSTWTIANFFMIAPSGDSTLAITHGGAVSSGDTSVGDNGATGTVVVSGAGATLTARTLAIGGSGTGILTIADGGKVSVGVGGSGIVTLGSHGGTGTVNIGAAAGSAAVAAGTLEAAGLRFAGGTGTLNFNHTGGAYVFAPKITGAGTIEQRSGTTILSGDSSGFSGRTLVTGGKLVVNGSLGGTLTLDTGATLGGGGTVSGVTVGSGATVAPGNSIGTLGVAGNVAFAAGSHYQVEIDTAGRSDKIAATGSAALAGGTVDVVKAPGAYLPGTRYTILTATGGVTGSFAGVTHDLLFLTLGLNYDLNNVYLDIGRNPLAFASVGVTRNQIAAAGAVEARGTGNSLYDAVLQQASAAGARAAFDGLSGEIHASAKGVLIDDSRFVRDAAMGRLRAAFGAAGAGRGQVTAYAADGPASAPATTDRFALWGQGFGSWGRTNGDGNAARLNRSTGGFLIGADGLVLDAWRLGLVAGYSRSSFSTRERASSGASDNIHLGLYGGGQWGALALRAGAAYTWHDVTTSRTVAFAGFGDSLKGGYKAATTQAFGELGYGIRVGPTPVGRLAFEPFANLAYVNVSTDGFSEKGGAAALTGRGEASGVTFTTLGLRAASEFMLGAMGVTARGTLGWRHAFGDTVPAASLAFAGGGAFSVSGAPIARNAAVVEAGIDVMLTPAATLGLSYGGQFGSGVTDQTVKGTFGLRF